MQYLPVYLYKNSIEVILDLDPITKGVNPTMYQHDLKIQKGVKNQIRIQFKNSDQKRIQIYNTQTFIFTMFDAINNRTILEKQLEIIDNTTSTKGLALLTLNESDTMNLFKSSYTYSVKLQESDGQFSLAYANTYYGVTGVAYVNDDINPMIKNSVEITSFNKVFNDDLQLYEYFSGDIYANPEYASLAGQHTIAVYLTSYKGKLTVEGTLDNNPGINPDYFTISSFEYLNYTGIETINFYGIFSYIRVKFIPDAAPGESNNDNQEYYGSFDKILYRS